MSLYMRLRLAHGLAWRTSRPPIPWRSLFAVGACAAVITAALYIDTMAARVDELEAVAESNSHYSKVFFDCMSAGANNETGGFYLPTSGKAFECRIQEI